MSVLGTLWSMSPGGMLNNAFGGGGSNALEKIGFGNSNKVDAANAQLAQNQGMIQDAYNKNEGAIGDYQNLIEGLYGSSPAQYRDALNKYINSDKFSYGKSAEDFYSPAADQRVKEAMNSITKSQANAGNMFSSDYLNSLNARSQAIASEEWDKAFDRMQQDRSNSMNEYSLNDSRLGNIASMLGNDMNNYASNMGNVYGNRINNANALTRGMMDLNTSIAQNEMNKKSPLQALLNPWG